MRNQRIYARTLVLIINALSSALTVVAWTNQHQSFKPRFVFKSTSEINASSQSVVVVSPPGGVGEVAAVKAAELGNSVRWFVVSGDEESVGSKDIVLSQETLDRIEAANGEVELAGATANSLLLSRDESGSSLNAVSAWCEKATSLICTFDGIVDKRKKKDEDDPTIPWKNAIKVAAQEAAKTVDGTKIAILSVTDIEDVQDESQQNQGIDLGSLVTGLVGGRRVDIPESLTDALGTTSETICVRYGQIFGTPESSPDFSPFVGGPRRQPELCQEYANAAVRVDPTIASSGNRIVGMQSSRHSVGQAVALLAAGQIPISKTNLDVCISSQPGTAPTTFEEWKTEFERVEKLMNSGESALLFEMESISVPNTDRLADWLRTKWAPAVMRTYEIATMTTGARPVSVNSLQGEFSGLEIVWQQLVNFEPVVAGKMIIQVRDTGVKAIRSAGDAKAGFGSVSSKPLQGEDVLVRRLAEATSQAVEKGLAIKNVPQSKIATVPVTAVPTVVSTIQSLETVEIASTSVEPARRRSTERARGSKRKKSDDE